MLKESIRNNKTYLKMRRYSRRKTEPDTSNVTDGIAKGIVTVKGREIELSTWM